MRNFSKSVGNIKLKSKTSKKVYLKFENGSIYEVSSILKYEDIEENHKLKKCDF